MDPNLFKSSRTACVLGYLLIFVFLFPSTGISIERNALMSWSDGQLQMKLERNALDRTYFISLGGNAANSPTAVVQQAGKIELVLNDYDLVSKSTMRLRDEELIQSIQVQAEDENTRISFDIEADGPYLTEWDDKKKILIVREVADVPPPQIIRAGIKSIPQPVVSTPQPVLEQAQISSEKPATEKLAALEQEVEDTATADLLLKSISYSDGSEKSTIQLAMTDFPEYQIRRKGGDHFTVYIKGADVSDRRLLLPRYAPVSHSFLRYLVTSRNEEGIVIDIFTEEGVELDSRVTEQVLSLEPKKVR